MLEVGLIAIETRQILPGGDAAEDTAGIVRRRKPVGVISSPCSLPLLADRGEAGADLDALDRVDRHHRGGDLGIELAGERGAQAHGDGAGDDLDPCTARIAVAAQAVEVLLERRDPAGVGDAERIGRHVLPADEWHRYRPSCDR